MASYPKGSVVSWLVLEETAGMSCDLAVFYALTRRARARLHRQALHHNATEAIGPFCVVPMPYNAEGQGPEMDPAKAVGVNYVVWDSLIVYQRYFSVLEEAMAFAGFLNGDNE